MALRRPFRWRIGWVLAVLVGLFFTHSMSEVMGMECAHDAGEIPAVSLSVSHLDIGATAPVADWATAVDADCTDVIGEASVFLLPESSGGLLILLLLGLAAITVRCLGVPASPRRSARTRDRPAPTGPSVRLLGCVSLT
jgi:hypothetical protein